MNTLFANTASEAEKKMVKGDSHFKVCSNCDFLWKNRNDFLSDDNISFVGYQVVFESPTAGLFLFNHSCKGTLALKVGAFEDLYNGSIFEKKDNNSDKCPEFCLYKKNYNLCPVKCECAFVREIIQQIK